MKQRLRIPSRDQRARLRFEVLEDRRLLTVATDVLLRVDITSGDAQMVFNGSQQISGYQIDSASGQLAPANWHTLLSQGNSGWSPFPATANIIAEGNPTGSLTSSTTIDLGNIFTSNGTHDLNFQWGDANSQSFNSSVEYVTQSSDLTISKSHTGNFQQGDAADNYSITVNNAGTGPTSGLVTVTDTLPTGLTPTAASGTGWTTSIVGSIVTATRSDALASGASYPTLAITVSVAANAPASVTNTAQVAGGGESNTANDTASDPTTITQLADLTISKSHTASFQQGDAADNYSITVNNAGTGPTSGTVTVTDTLPTGLTPTAASGTGWTTSIVGSTVTATRNDALAGGASYPTLAITVSVASNAPTSVTNTAQVAGGGELNTANDTASDPTTITAQSPDLTISKSHTGNFRQGDTADNYSITVNNAGSLSSSGMVTVTDTLPAGLTPTAASGTGWTTSIVGLTVTATRSDALASGASYATLAITVSVASNAPASVTNTALVAGGGELNTANDSANDPTTITQVADLTISKSHTGNFQQSDAADNYAITVNNLGPGPTSGLVTVTDTLPTGLTPTAASGTGWTTSIVGSTVTATRSDALASGASYPTLAITVSVASNAPASVTNTALVAGGGELNTANDTANDPTTITQVADLTISKSHTGNFQQSDTADNYSITVNNLGPGPTSGLVTVTDTLPTGLTPTAASGTGWTTSILGSTVTATRSDSLASGASYPTLAITVSVAANAPVSVTNTAQVAGGGELNTANDTANDPTTITQVADLTISKNHTASFQQGDAADNYAITVNNVGSISSTGTVTVTDTLPTGLTPTAASGTGWTTSIVGSTVTATRSDALSSGASYPTLAITVSVASNAPASVTNTAQVAGGGELNTANDTANDPTTITQVADLTISKNHTASFQQSDTADNYSITVNNVGPGPTSGTVTVTDTLPTGLTPTAASGTGWTTSIVGSTVTATRSDSLASGASYPTLAITVSVAANAPVSVTNTAQVAGGGELNTANDTANDPTTISVASGSISGFVYLDSANNGQRIPAQGQPNLGLQGVTIKLLSLDSQGNWVEVAGKSPVQTGSDGSYRFDGLIAATYRVQETPPSNFVDGKATVGTVGGTTKGTAGTDQLDIQLGPGENGSEYNFSVRGLRPELISLRLFLASTPPVDQILQHYLNNPVTPALAAATLVGNALPQSSPAIATSALTTVSTTNSSSGSNGIAAVNTSYSSTTANPALAAALATGITAPLSATTFDGNALPQSSPAIATSALTALSTTNSSSGSTVMAVANATTFSTTATRAKSVVSARAMLASVDHVLQQSHDWLQA